MELNSPSNYFGEQNFSPSNDNAQGTLGVTIETRPTNEIPFVEEGITPEYEQRKSNDKQRVEDLRNEKAAELATLDVWDT